MTIKHIIEIWFESTCIISHSNQVPMEELDGLYYYF